MTDKQLAKYRTRGGDLFRICWFGYGSGVASVLELFDGTEWNELERVDEGKGSPSPDEERHIEQRMKQKMELYAKGNEFEQVEGPEVRQR